MAKKKKVYKYPKGREGCTSAVVTLCGVSLSLFAEVQMKHRIATGRTLTMQGAFNYIMTDYINLRNQSK